MVTPIEFVLAAFVVGGLVGAVSGALANGRR